MSDNQFILLIKTLNEIASWLKWCFIGTILITISIIILTCSDSHADKWTKGEVVAEVAWQALHLVDWGTTRNIAMDPEHYQEVGPARLLIGKHPSTQQVDIAMGLSAVLHPIITNWLPRKSSLFGYQVNPRAMWQYFSIGTTGYCVINNLSIGLHVKF